MAAKTIPAAPPSSRPALSTTTVCTGLELPSTPPVKIRAATSTVQVAAHRNSAAWRTRPLCSIMNELLSTTSSRVMAMTRTGAAELSSDRYASSVADISQIRTMCRARAVRVLSSSSGKTGGCR